MHEIDLYFYQDSGELGIRYWTNFDSLSESRKEEILAVDGYTVMAHEGTRYYSGAAYGQYYDFEFAENGSIATVSVLLFEGHTYILTLERISDTACKVIAVEGSTILTNLAVGDILEA